MPDRRRQRYGDMEYDWEHRVDTTSGTTGWRERLFGLFHSPYQPTDAVLFREMMARLPIRFEDFVFIDIGSGKGRALLLASEYPFQKIVGVELIEELHRVAERNIRAYQNANEPSSRRIESIHADALDYDFPETAMVLYFFNPLPEPALVRVLERLEKSIEQHPRAVWLLYHNPLLESALRSCAWLSRVAGTEQYCIYKFLPR